MENGHSHGFILGVEKVNLKVKEDTDTIVVNGLEVTVSKASLNGYFSSISRLFASSIFSILFLLFSFPFACFFQISFPFLLPAPLDSSLTAPLIFLLSSDSDAQVRRRRRLITMPTRRPSRTPFSVTPLLHFSPFLDKLSIHILSCPTHF